MLPAVPAVHNDLEQISARKIQRDFKRYALSLLNFWLSVRLFPKAELFNGSVMPLPEIYHVSAGVYPCVNAESYLIVNLSVFRSYTKLYVPLFLATIFEEGFSSRASTSDCSLSTLSVFRQTLPSSMPLVVFTEILREIIEHKGISGDKLMRIGIYVFSAS